jgi:hypothetical protein
MIKSLQRLLPQNSRQAFWISFLACLVLGFFILFVVSPITGLSKNFGEGNDGYIQLARSLAAGSGYVFEKNGPPVFHRPPLYPLFLVPVALFPENLQRYVIVIPQSILVGFIGMMIFRIARQLYNRNVAAVSLLLFLINPWVYWNAKNPMTPILQTFLYLIFAYFAAVELFDKTDSRPRWRGLVIGAAGAALSLIHAVMLPVVFIFIFALFLAALFRDRKRIPTSAVAGLIVVCLIAPWTYRNWVVFGRFIPIAGGGGLAYFNGNVHWAGIEDEPQRPAEGYINASLRILGIEGTEQTRTHWKGFKDIRDEDLADMKMVEHIKSHPALFIKKVILNAIEYYFPAFAKPFFAIKEVTVEQCALSVFHLVLWIMAVIGIFRCWRLGLLLLVGIIFYSVWYFPFATGFIGHSLYTFATIPFLCILSGAGIMCFFRKENQSVC